MRLKIKDQNLQINLKTEDNLPEERVDSRTILKPDQIVTVIFSQIKTQAVNLKRD
jgi:hypothetical protein